MYIKTKYKRNIYKGKCVYVYIDTNTQTDTKAHKIHSRKKKKKDEGKREREREREHLQRQKSVTDNWRINSTWKLSGKNPGIKMNNLSKKSPLYKSKSTPPSNIINFLIKGDYTWNTCKRTKDCLKKKFTRGTIHFNIFTLFSPWNNKKVFIYIYIYIYISLGKVDK